MTQAELQGGQGAYDALYAGTPGLLWPAHPGRMVAQAAQLLPPGRALDLGCGDGKNLLYLEERGWTVDGLDVSPHALRGARLRMAQAVHAHRGGLLCSDIVTWHPPGHRGTYDLVIAYGLFHCLDDRGVTATLGVIRGALRTGGLLAFAAFNDRLPVPDGHETGPLALRDERHILECLPGWRVAAFASGEISEAHPPVIGPHSHAVTWALLENP